MTGWIYECISLRLVEGARQRSLQAASVYHHQPSLRPHVIDDLKWRDLGHQGFKYIKEIEDTNEDGMLSTCCISL